MPGREGPAFLFIRHRQNATCSVFSGVGAVGDVLRRLPGRKRSRPELVAGGYLGNHKHALTHYCCTEFVAECAFVRNPQMRLALGRDTNPGECSSVNASRRSNAEIQILFTNGSFRRGLRAAYVRADRVDSGYGL